MGHTIWSRRRSRADAAPLRTPRAAAEPLRPIVMSSTAGAPSRTRTPVEERVTASIGVTRRDRIVARVSYEGADDAAAMRARGAASAGRAAPIAMTPGGAGA